MIYERSVENETDPSVILKSCYGNADIVLIEGQKQWKKRVIGNLIDTKRKIGGANWKQRKSIIYV